MLAKSRRGTAPADRALQPQHGFDERFRCLWTEEGWVYLAVVIDLFSRQVVGFAMSERMTWKLVIDALRMAWFRRRQ